MKQANKTITERDIQRALRQFRLAGGKIQHIPDQVTPRLAAVHSRWESFAAITSAPSALPTVAPDATPRASE